MVTASHTTEAGERAAPSPAPILVATDGTQQSEGALAVARAMAESLGTTTRVLAVQPSLNIVLPDASLLLESSATTRLTVELEQRVRKQCAEMSADGTGPALMNPDIETGEPERVICRVAEEQDAALVVVGIGRHDVTDRIFGSETALKVARLSRAAVLAVPGTLRTIPRRAIVGVDFSEGSLEAAKIVVHLIG